MELTTRCPQCETVFSASLEQLQLRKGYIRCINCANIFDGFEAVVPAATPSAPQKRGGGAPKQPTEPTGLSLVRTPRTASITSQASVREMPPANTEPEFAPFIIPPAGEPPVIPAGEDRDFSIGASRVAASASSNEPTVGPARVAPTGRSGPYVPDTSENTVPHDAREPRLPSVLRERAGRPTPAKDPAIPSPATPGREPGRHSIARSAISEPVIASPRAPEHQPVIASRRAPNAEPIIASPGAPHREPVISSAGGARTRGIEHETGDADTHTATTDTDTFLFVEPRSQRRSSQPQSGAFGDQAARGRWMTPVWAVLTLCGAVLLLAQMVYVYRAQLANTFPGLRPTLEQACEPLSCSVPYERRLDAIAITGSALRANAAPEDGVSSLTLEVTLRNTYDRPQEWPTLVLDLKDASGTIVVRRNLPPQAWVPSALREGPFMPGADLTVQVPLTVQGVQANGYQLDKFFP